MNHFRRPGPQRALFAFVFAAGAALSQAASYYVSPTGNDSSNTGLTADSPLRTIGKAIALAAAGDTVVLEDANPFAEAFEINKPITLTSLNGKSKSIIRPQGIKITSAGAGLVKITNLTFASANGARALTITGARAVAISGCDFKLNTALSAGGAISISGSPVTISGCKFDTNTAPDKGGAISADATSALRIDTASTFISNGLPSTLGGAVYTAGSLTVDSSSFKSNNGGQGGAVYADTTASLTIARSTFDSNFSTKEGGAVYCQNGGVFQWNSFSANASQNVSGGAIYGISKSASVPLRVENSLFYRNQGSAVVNGGSGKFTYCTFANNTGYYGGALNCVYGSTVALLDCIMWGDVDTAGFSWASEIYSVNSTITSYYSDVQSGALAGPGNVSVDPQFGNPGADNYILQNTSAVAAAGTPVSSIGDDLLHHNRNLTHPSMGAYQAGNFWTAVAQAPGGDGLHTIWWNWSGTVRLATYGVTTTYTGITSVPTWTPMGIAVDSSNINYVLWRTDTGGIEVWKVATGGFHAKIDRPIVAGPWTEKSLVAMPNGHLTLMLGNGLGFAQLYDIDPTGLVAAPVQKTAP